MTHEALPTGRPDLRRRILAEHLRHAEAMLAIVREEGHESAGEWWAAEAEAWREKLADHDGQNPQ